MGHLDQLPIVREGVWLYNHSVLVRIRVLASPETWGTGDYEDDSSVSKNQPIRCFFIVYESAGSSGNFNNIIPNIENLNTAYEMVEQKFPEVKWW